MTAAVSDSLVGTVFDRRLKNKKDPATISQVVDVTRRCRVSEGKVLVLYATANKRLFARCVHCVEDEKGTRFALQTRYWPVREARMSNQSDCFPELKRFAQQVSAITCVLAECIKNKEA